jgi:hypothetical protein
MFPKNLTPDKSRALALKLLLVLLITGYLILFVASGLAFALVLFSVYIVVVLLVITKLFP